MAAAKVFLGQADPERHSGQGVAPGFDLQVCWGEMFSETVAAGVVGEAPEIAGDVLFQAFDFAEAGDGGEKNAAGLEDAAALAEGGVDVVDVLERLGEDDAVVGFAGDGGEVAEVADEGGAGVVGVDVEDVGAGDGALGGEAAGVEVVFDLETVAADVGGVVGEEGLDVEAVDGVAAIAAGVVADRVRAGEEEVEKLGVAEAGEAGAPS